MQLTLEVAPNLRGLQAHETVIAGLPRVTVSMSNSSATRDELADPVGYE